MTENTFWVFIFQTSKMFLGLINIIIVPIYLNTQDQGLWFLMLSFGSILMLYNAAQNNIILIFNGNESKSITFEQFLMHKYEKIEGFIKYFSFFFTNALIILCVILSVVYFIYIKEEDIYYPFILYIIGLGIFITNFLFLFIIESFNEVALANKYKSILIILIGIFLIYFLINRYAIHSLYLSYLIVNMLFLLYSIYQYKSKILEIIKVKCKVSKNKKKVFLNYFKKNIYSMLSGFILFQMYTPLVYATNNGINAGKIGLSISIMTALFAFSSAILHAKLPYVIKLASTKKYHLALDAYKKTAYQAFALYIVLFCVSIYLLYYLDSFMFYRDRIINLTSFIILSISWLLQLVTYSIVSFTRIFKRELFVKITIISTLYVFLSTMLILKYFSFEYIFLGLLTSYIFGLPYIFIKSKIFLQQKGVI